jgi:outer membrane protein TolC
MATGSGKRVGYGLVGWTVAVLVGAGPLVAQERAVTGVSGALTLDEAVALALRRSRELEGSYQSLEAADQRVREAWGSVFPRVNLSASYTRSLSIPGNFLPRIFFDPDAGPDELVAVRFGADNSWSFQLRAEQPVFDAAAFIGVGAAGRYEMLQDETHRGTAQRVATRTRVAFYEVLLAQEALRLSENSVQRVRQVLAETEALNRAGLASEYDVLRLRVELANLEPSLRRSRNALEEAKRRLGIELGLQTLDGVEVSGSLAALGAEAALAGGGGGAEKASVARGGVDLDAMAPEEVVRLALQRRSDLRQLDLTARLRQTELRLEQVEYLPKVSVFGLYTINAQQNGSPDFFGSSSLQRAYGRQVGVQVTMPLFSGFQRPARVAQKRAVLRQVELQRALVSVQAEHEVRTLIDQVREARARAEAQGLAVEQARRGFEIASAKYREGLGSQLEVTDAEVALRQSEFNHAEAIYDYLVARARLDEAAGMVPLVDTGDGFAHER